MSRPVDAAIFRLKSAAKPPCGTRFSCLQKEKGPAPSTGLRGRRVCRRSIGEHDRIISKTPTAAQCFIALKLVARPDGFTPSRAVTGRAICALWKGAPRPSLLAACIGIAAGRYALRINPRYRIISTSLGSGKKSRRNLLRLRRSIGQAGRGAQLPGNLADQIKASRFSVFRRR
jgi:hypothetical protein